MTIPSRYRLTKDIVSLLNQLEKLKTTLDLLPVNKKLELYYRKKNILKSALYSARIEGNPLTVDDLFRRLGQSSHKLELTNLSRAMELIFRSSWRRRLIPEDLKHLHSVLLSGLSGNAGNFRQNSSAIFNSAGVAVYVCPGPAEIKPMMVQLLSFINLGGEPFPAAKAALVHLAFEKIHPFLDGNGRVGRLLIHLILKKCNSDFRGLAVFEEYFDQNRQEYYDLLAKSGKDATSLVEFCLKGFVYSLKQAVKAKSIRSTVKKEDLLPPRRQEMLRIIRDHRSASLDFLQRRFVKVSGRLLRYDLKKLVDGGFIRKLGITRGAIYEVISE